MCLAIPAKVIAIDDYMAEVECFGNTRKVGLTLCPDVKIGDYVMVHAGFVIEILDEQYALESQELWKEMIKHEQNQQ